MNEESLVYTILILFSLNVAGIAGVWQGISTIADKLDNVKDRLTVLETNFSNHCKKEVNSNG